MRFIVGGLQKSSLLDYPRKISAIIFTQGCNFRCSYCHNPELIHSLSISDIQVAKCLEFLKTRKGKLDGVVITGGEPTLQLDLKKFIKAIKKLGFLVKLDTNGAQCDVLVDLLNNELLDYIAMDIKAPLEKYSQITSALVDTKKIYKSIDLIMNSGIDYEFRTTVLKSQLGFDDFRQIGKLIYGAKKYFLQKFVPVKGLVNTKSYTDDDFKQIKNDMLRYVKKVEIR